jgi:hypothetical protein
MLSVTNCRCGELTIEAPQHEIDAFLKHARNAGIDVQQGVTKPPPLGVPEMDFPPLRKVEEAPTWHTIEQRSGEDKNGRVMVHNLPTRADGKPEPMPVYNVEYPPLKKVTGN